jgi:membrane-bound serine protease (ClpP class)
MRDFPQRFAFLCCCMWLAALLAWPVSARCNEAAEPRTYQRPVLIRAEGVIDDWFESYLMRKIDRAIALDCDLLVLEIDSPGGGLWETIQLCERLTELKNIRTVAYVPEAALSGAAIISLACDEIVIGKFARFGDCGPIYMAEDFLYRHASEKVKSDLIARVRVLSEKKGHSPALAEAMVDMNTPVLRVKEKNTLEEKLVTEREAAALNDTWERLETLPESGGGRFLTLTGERAMAVKLAAATLDSRTDLQERYSLATPFQELKPNGVDVTLYVLNHWFVTLLILLVGLSALGYELSAPGIGVGGLVASLCFALFFWSRFLGGTSGWLEVLLFLAGVLFLAVELFVLPGFGIAGFMGILLLVGSLVLASLDFTMPQNNDDVWKGTHSLLTVLGAVGCGGLVIAFTLRHMESIPVLKRLMLKPPSESEVAAPSKDEKGNSTPSPAYQVGDWGEAVTVLRPAGKARFGDEMLDVVADGGFVNAGASVQIIALHGSRIVVQIVAKEVG